MMDFIKEGINEMMGEAELASEDFWSEKMEKAMDDVVNFIMGNE